MTQFNAPTYDVDRPTGQCAFSGRALQAGEAYMATLVEVDPVEQPPAAGKANASGTAAVGLGLKRLDVSMDQWQQGQRPPRLFSHWKTTLVPPEQKKRLFVDDEVLLNLFRRLADTDQPQRLAFRFVLCLILMRKRLLKYDGMTKRPRPASDPRKDDPAAAEEWWSVIPRGQDQVAIDVLNPQLDEQQIRQVSEQLSEILEAEL